MFDVEGNKAEVMAEEARDINPEIDIRIVTDAIGPENAEEFLQDADIFVDAIDVFAIGIRRLLFGMAASQGIYAVTAGPVGLGNLAEFRPERDDVRPIL